MTQRTTFGRAVLVTVAMTVLVLGLATTGEAKGGTHSLKCRSIGSFYDPSGPTGPQVIASSVGKCSAGLGKVTSASVSVVLGPDVASGPNCVFLASVGPDFAMAKKAFITYTNVATQCFEDASGVALGGLPAGFCGGGPLDAFFSTVTGIYTITGGFVKGHPVVGGAGIFTSLADHCAGGTAPFGNFFRTKLTGTIVFP